MNSLSLNHLWTLETLANLLEWHYNSLIEMLSETWIQIRTLLNDRISSIFENTPEGKEAYQSHLLHLKVKALIREHQHWVIQNQSKTIKRMFKLCSSDNIAELQCKRVCDNYFSLWRTTGVEQLQTVFTVKKRNPNWTASTAVHFLVNDLQLVI